MRRPTLTVVELKVIVAAGDDNDDDDDADVDAYYDNHLTLLPSTIRCSSSFAVQKLYL